MLPDFSGVLILDVLSWFIIWVFIAFAILPCILDNNEGYKKALAISFIFQGFLLAMCLILFFVVWSFLRVTS